MKLNSIHRLFAKAASALMVLSLLIVFSCNDDSSEDSVKKATAQFATSLQTMSESGTPLSITIKFDKPVEKNGSITIDLAGTAAYSSDYITNPNGTSGTFDIFVTEGQSVAQFTVTPINNALLGDVNKKIEFTIIGASSAFQIGEKTLNTLTILDDEGPTVANFATDVTTTDENLTAGTNVTINLSSPAPGTGSLTISFTSSTAVYTTDFITEPAATAGQLVVPVTVGATSVTFKVKPVNNIGLNEDHEITFTIAGDDGVVNVGADLIEHTFTINDDEIASVATFASPSSTMEENDVPAGINVSIALAPQTIGTGTVKVTIDSDATYGDDYTVEGQTVTSGAFVVTVPDASSTVTFNVVPVDNDVNSESLVLNFTLSDPTGIVVLGSSNLTHELTVVDDEIDPVLVSVDDVRDLYLGSAASIETGAYIEATVTTSADNVAGDYVFVQDASGGIALNFTSANSTIELGDVIKVKIGDENTGVKVNSSNGLIQIEGLNYSLVEELSTGGTVTPTIISMTQANSGNYQGSLVTIENIYIEEANGTETYGGINTITDGTNDLVTFVRNSGSPQASFKDDVVEQGIGSITGIMTTTAGPIQELVLRTAADVNFSIVGTLNVTEAITDFGIVISGNTSAAQQFTIGGTTLVKNVFVTAPSSFEVSTDGTNYSSQLELDFNNVNGGLVTIHVRFRPTTGVAGVRSGALTMTSIGAENKTINLSGTEHISTHLFTENFDYTVGDLLTAHGWSSHSGAGTQAITITNGLTYTGYPSSGVGGAALVDNTGEDVNKTFTAQTSGTIYFSALINVTNAVDGYFLHLGTGAGTFGSRIYMKPSVTAGKVIFGLAYQSAQTYGTTDFDLNTTYLVIVKYSFDSGSGSLWVVPSGIPASEAAAGTAEVSSTGTKLTTVDAVYLRQFNATQNVTVDGIRVTKAWFDLFN